MQLYVVYDEMGSGRLVGIFDSELKANEIQKINSNYYRVISCDLNEVQQEALGWLPEHLKLKLIDSQKINKPDSL